MSTLKVNAIEPYSGGTVTITGGTIDSASFATTASYAETANTLTPGMKSISQLTITGGTGSDLIVTGSGLFSGLSADGGVVAGTTNKAYLNSQFIGLINGTTSDEIGFTDNGNDYGVTGWAGPSIYANDPTDSYPALIGFQNKADWTDGKVTVLKPLDVSGSVSVNNTITATQLTLTGGAGTDLNVTGNGVFTSALSAVVGVSSTQSGTTAQITGGDGGFVEVADSAGSNIGLGLNPSAYGTTGWTGPGIWSNDPANNYPVLIGFQDKSSWTDGGVTFLTPTVMTAGMSIQGLGDYVDDAAAATGGVAVNGVYRTGSTLKIRVS